MSEPRRHKPRVSLTKAQIQEGISAELFSLCQGITADGRLSKDEIVALGLWLHDNRDADLPGIAFLSDTLNHIIADGRVTQEGQRELMEAIERVLSPDARKTAKAARRAVEAKRKADVIADRNEKRKQELESQEKRWPEDEFDFMVAGINFDGRYRIIKTKVAAHKAVMLTNSEFTKGAVAAAMDDGIALHIVRPEFNFGDLHANDATTIQAQILQISASRPQPIYSNEVVYRAFDLARVETAAMQLHPYGSTGVRPGLPHSFPMVTGSQNRALSHGGGPGVNRGGSIGGSTRQGGGPGFRKR